MGRKRNSRKKAEARTAEVAPAKKADRNQRKTKLSAMLVWLSRNWLFIVACVSAMGWITDRTLLRQPQVTTPEIKIFNAPAENLDPAIRAYFQYPAYKELIVNYGGALVFPNSHKLSTAKIGNDAYLMIHLDGEQETRAFNISAMPVKPFSLEINRNGIRSLVTVEQVKETGVQLRTFRSIK
jgi:hypothetical protein